MAIGGVGWGWQLVGLGEGGNWWGGGRVAIGGVGEGDSWWGRGGGRVTIGGWGEGGNWWGGEMVAIGGMGEGGNWWGGVRVAMGGGGGECMHASMYVCMHVNTDVVNFKCELF